MTEADIRFGILGAGRVAHDFATGLGVVEGARLAAVASRSRTTANVFAQSFPGTGVLDGFDALAADPSIDVIYVATPHHLHAEHSVMCLQAGKPILCEKPFAVDAAQARRIVSVARERRLFCMEAMWMRFFPAVQHAAKVIGEGVIGDPRILFADFGVATAGGPESRFFDPAQGGGALLDRGVYAVSLATMLFGEPTRVIAAAGTTPTGVDEHTGIVLEFAGGRLAVLSASLTTYSSNEASVSGTLGRLTIPAPFYCPSRVSIRHHRVQVTTDAQPSRRDDMVAFAKRSRIGRKALRVAKPILGGRPTVFDAPIEGNGYGYEAAEVVRCLRAGELESPIMPLDESIRVMEVLDAVRAAWHR